MAEFEVVDITGRAFAMRLANLLVGTRAHDGRSVGSIARVGQSRFSKRDLKAFERGDRILDEKIIDELVQLYQCDLGVILPLRLPVEVSANTISAGGVREVFEAGPADAVLVAYLTLIRRLRREDKAPVVDLRRDDIDVLAGYLGESSASILQRLATLMQSTQTKRTAMMAVFASGAVVIGLVGTALAVGGTSAQPSDTRPDSRVTTTQATVPPSTPATLSSPSTTMPPLIEENVTTTVVDGGTPPVP